MKVIDVLARSMLGLAFVLSAAVTWAADYPAPETGVLDREIKRVKNGRVFLIPGSDQAAGHGTTGQARFWKQQLGEVLQMAPRGGQ